MATTVSPLRKSTCVPRVPGVIVNDDVAKLLFAASTGDSMMRS